jgi:hypothetical protein
MNRRQLLASLAGLIATLPLAGKAKAEPEVFTQVHHIGQSYDWQTGTVDWQTGTVHWGAGIWEVGDDDLTDIYHQHFGGIPTGQIGGRPSHDTYSHLVSDPVWSPIYPPAYDYPVNSGMTEGEWITYWSLSQITSS